jgi:hypothetical protein
MGDNDRMAGRHRAKPVKRARRGRHRARTLPSRGLLSLVAVTTLTAAGGGAAAYFALEGGTAPHPASGVRAAARLQPLVSGAHPKSSAPTGHPAHRQAHRRAHRKVAAAGHRPAAEHRTRPALRVHTTDGSSWVEVLDRHGSALVERTLPPHRSLTVRQHDLRLTLGNGGSVALVIDGHRIAPAGRLGEVCHFTVR